MTNREAEIIGLVHKEVKPALGCTEPVAVALATARAIEIMMSNVNGFSPAESSFKINVEVSGNILKNGMGVGIPGTGMIGLRVAAALGAVCGKSSYGLEVLKDLDKDSISAAKKMVAEDGVCISIAHDCPKLYVKAIIVIDNHKAWAVIEMSMTSLSRPVSTTRLRFWRKGVKVNARARMTRRPGIII